MRYHAGPAIGWRVHPRFKIGAALFGVYQTLEGRARLLLGTNDPNTMPPTQATLLVDVTARPIRLCIEAAIGAQLEPVDGFHVA